MYGLNQKEINEIKNILKKHSSKAILFGSRAKGNYKKGNDIDIAIIGDEREVSYLLNEEIFLPYFFDIVNLEKIKNKNLIEHIQSVGKIL